jgi:2-methylcitrate synthase
METLIIPSYITKMERGEKLIIRGYEVSDLAQNAGTIEEVIFLLLNQRLPEKMELELLIKKISLMRFLPQNLKNCLENIPITTDGITVVGIAISILGAIECNSELDDMEICLRIISLIGPISAYWHIFHTTGRRIETYTGDNDSIIVNFFKLYFEKEYESKLQFIKPLNKILIVISDLGIPPVSTHVSRVAASASASIFSSAAAGIFAFSGKLHGAAGYLCGEMLEGIKSEDEARAYV